MPSPGDRFTVLTTLKGYVNFSDAERYLSGHNHDYSYVTIEPGEYIVFGSAASDRDLVNISKAKGKPGWWIRESQNIEPKKLKILTTLKGFKNFSDAIQGLAPGNSYGPYNSETISPGEYYIFSTAASDPDLININTIAGQSGWWIRSSLNVEPEKFHVNEGYRGYNNSADAVNMAKEGWTLVPPGDYYVYEYLNGDRSNSVLNITATAGQSWKWVNKSQGDSSANSKIKLNSDTKAYLMPENAFARRDGFTIGKGDYYYLFDSDDGSLAYVSYPNLPTGPGFWVRKDDLEEAIRYSKISINLPMPAYSSVKLALENDSSNAKENIEAGEYYILSMHENDKVAHISKNPKDAQGVYINTGKNDENAEKENSDGSEKRDPEPSNTETTSGIDNKPKKTGSLTGKDSESVNIPGTYDCPPCFIKNLITGTTIQLRSGLPEGMSDNANASFDPANIRGRSNQIQGYSDTEARTVSFDYTFHEELEPEGLLTVISRIKALEYPGYASVVEPPKCYLRLGNVVRGTFICTDASVSYKDDAGSRDDYYLGADVSFSFTETNDFARSAAEIEDGGGMIE